MGSQQPGTMHVKAQGQPAGCRCAGASCAHGRAVLEEQRLPQCFCVLKHTPGVFLADKLKFDCKIQPLCINHRLFYGRYAGEDTALLDETCYGSPSAQNRSCKVCAVQIVICYTFWTRRRRSSPDYTCS